MLIAVVLLAGARPARAAGLTADDIISRVAARSAASAKARQDFAYERVSRVDYLDEAGGVKKKTVRTYEVAPVNGRSVTRLVQIDGRAATDKDEPGRSSGRETGEKSRGLDFGEELLSRFAYQLRGEEIHQERPVWVLDFSPKPGIESDGFADRLIHAMQGTMWIDQEDYDLAKIDVRLGRKISFFGGIAGAIDKLELQVVQKRVDPAVWLPEGLALHFSGRKLLTPVRLRCFETCTGFRRAAGAP